MNSNNPSISIIIRCFNEERYIGRLLEGIKSQNIQDVEIILVDSGSTDSTLDIAAEYAVKIINICPEKFSFGYSLNRGCEIANGEFIVIVSAHVFPVYENWLQKLIEPFKDKQAGLVYGKQRGEQNSKFSEKQIFKRWFPDTPDNNQNHPFCNNANAAIRRELWKSYKYDEGLTGLEDLAWAKLIQNNGYKIIYEPDALIIHVHDETPERIYNRYRREAMALINIYPDHRFTFIDMCFLTISNTINDIFHAVREGISPLSYFEIIQFRTCQFLGAYHGHNKHSEITRELRNKFYYPHNFRSLNNTVEDNKNNSPQIKYTLDTNQKNE